jgi:2'-5' RNA ligase
VRIFIAINISSQAKKEVGKLLKILKRKHWRVKWEDQKKLHLTLAFLGNIKDTDQKLKIIKKAIKKASSGVKPFEVAFKGLGCFPDFDQPRVIWLDLRGDLKSLAKLQKGIIGELLKVKDELSLGERIIKGLRRPFSGHITLGRIKGVRTRERREIGRQVQKIKEQRLKSKIFSGSKVFVDRLIIYESRLSRLGAKYKKIAEVKL